MTSRNPSSPCLVAYYHTLTTTVHVLEGVATSVLNLGGIFTNEGKEKTYEAEDTNR